MAEPAQKLVYMTEEEYERLLRERQHEIAEDPTFLAIAQAQRIPRTAEFSRKEVVQAFQSAFQLIGGVTRLALWANDHPGEFYKLYSRLLPSQASPALGEANEVVVRHVIARSPLDE